VDETDWAQQPVTRTIDWNSRAWMSSNCLERIPVNAKSLNELLLDTACAFKHDRTTLRRSRARRCWQMSYAFTKAGLNVAQPILMFEDRFGPLRLNAYFVNEFLDGQELLTLLPTMISEDQQRVSTAIEDAFEKMKAARLTHGDLKASNLMWCDNKLYFIDLDAAQHHNNSVTWQQAHNKDRKRFLKNWQQDSQLLALFER